MILEIIISLLLCSFIIIYLDNELRGILYYIILMPVSLQSSNLTSYFGFSFNFQHILTMIFVILFLYHKIKKKDFYIKSNYLYLPFIYLIILLISSFKSYYINLINSQIFLRGTTVSLFNLPFFRSFSRIGLAMFFIFLILIFYYYATNKRYFLIMLKTYLYNSTIISLFGVIFWFLYLIIDSSIINFFVHYFGDITPRVKSLFNEPIIFSIYLTISLPFLISLIITKNKFFNRKILYSMFLIQLIGLILSFSRSGWLALIIIFITIIYYNFHQIYLSLNSLFKFKGLIFLFFFVIFFLLFNMIFTNNLLKSQFEHHIISSFKYGDDKVYSTISRLISYKYAILSFKEHLLLGIGYENFIFYGSNKIIPWISGSVSPIHFPEINSLYLRFLTELGLIGFIIVLFLGLNILKYLIRSIKNSENDLLRSLSIGFLAGFLGLLTQYLLYSNLNYTFLWFYFGLMFASFKLSQIKNFNLS